MAYKRKNGKQPGLIIYHEYHESLEILAQQEGAAAVGNVVLALLDYNEGGVIPTDHDLTPTEMMLFTVMRSRADAAAAAYREKCERNAISGQRGGLTKALNAATTPEKKESYLSALTTPRGVPAVMGGLMQERPQPQSAYGEWAVPIPKRTGGMAALTPKNTDYLRGVFPDLDLYDTALRWAAYLNTVGDSELPKIPEDEFEEWCREVYKNA